MSGGTRRAAADAEAGSDPACELCQAARVTPWHHEDEVCWVADCEVCGVPMVVWRRHGAEPPESERAHMLATLTAVADARFGSDTWTLDPVMRQIPTHFHAHARDQGWWWRRIGAAGPPAPAGSPG